MKSQRSLIVMGLILGVLVFAVNSQADLVGYWKFDEGSGTKAADSSGKGKDGTIFNVNNGLGKDGSVWVKDADRGSVISFGGTAAGAYVKVGTGVVPLMNFTNDCTWSFWAKITFGNAGNNIVVGNRMSEKPADFTPRQFIKFTPTKFEYHCNGNGDDNTDFEDMPFGVWTHHVIVKKGKDFSYFKNGVAGVTKTATTEIPVTHTTKQEQTDLQPLFFGGDNEGADGEMFHGYLDSVRIYNEALSVQAVADLYKSEYMSGSKDWNSLR